MVEVKMNRDRAAVTLKKGEGRALKAGGMWIYDNEIASVEGCFADGDVVEVRDFHGKRIYQFQIKDPGADAFQEKGCGD